MAHLKLIVNDMNGSFYDFTIRMESSGEPFPDGLGYDLCFGMYLEFFVNVPEVVAYSISANEELACNILGAHATDNHI